MEWLKKNKIPVSTSWWWLEKNKILARYWSNFLFIVLTPDFEQSVNEHTYSQSDRAAFCGSQVFVCGAVFRFFPIPSRILWLYIVKARIPINRSFRICFRIKNSDIHRITASPELQLKSNTLCLYSDSGNYFILSRSVCILFTSCGPDRWIDFQASKNRFFNFILSFSLNAWKQYRIGKCNLNLHFVCISIVRFLSTIWHTQAWCLILIYSTIIVHRRYSFRCLTLFLKFSSEFEFTFEEIDFSTSPCTLL